MRKGPQRVMESTRFGLRGRGEGRGPVGKRAGAAPKGAGARSLRVAFLLGLLLLGSPLPVSANDFGGESEAASPEGSPKRNCDSSNAKQPCCDECPCQPKPGDATCSSTSGTSTAEPVSVVRGSEILDYVDLVVPGVSPIVMRRSYDSQTRYDSPLGHGWAFTYDLQLYEYPDGSVVIRTATGTRQKYLPSGGSFVSPAGVLSKLRENSDGSFTLRYGGGAKAHFDVQGRLTALESPQGNRLEMSYAPGGPFPLTGTSRFSVDPSRPIQVGLFPHVTRISERLADGTVTGRGVDFAYDATTGRLVSITASDGRVVAYEHDVLEVDGVPLTQGNLIRVLGLEGIVETYTYDDPNDAHNVTSIQRGQGTTPYVNTYDAEDRVITQTYGDRVFAFDYTTPLRTVVTRTIVDEQGENPKTAVTTYEFDTEGLLTRRIDALGNEFRSVRDAAGYLLRREIYYNRSGDRSEPELVLESAMGFEYDAEGRMTARSTVLSNGEVITQSWECDKGWTRATELVSSADPTKLFRTEYTFYRNSLGEPTNLREIQRRRSDGSYDRTAATAPC